MKKVFNSLQHPYLSTCSFSQPYLLHPCNFLRYCPLLQCQLLQFQRPPPALDRCRTPFGEDGAVLVKELHNRSLLLFSQLFRKTAHHLLDYFDFRS